MTTLIEMNDDTLIPEREFAVVFGNHVRGTPYHRHTLINWRSAGTGPPWIKIGRDVVYRAGAAKRHVKKLETAE